MPPEQEKRFYFKKAFIWGLYCVASWFLFLLFLNITGLDKIQGLSIGTDGEGSVFGSLLNLFVNFSYYAFPLVLAIIFGLRYKPFVKNFIAIILFVFAIHFVYSLTTFFLTKIYMQSQVQSVPIRFDSLSHKVTEENGFSIITLSGNIYYSKKVSDNERYVLFTYPNQDSVNGGKIVFEDKTSDITLTNNSENKNSFSQLFALSYAEKNNPITLDLELRKKIQLDIFGTTLSKFCGMSAFFCRDLLKNMDSPKSILVSIDKVSNAYTFSIK